MLKIEANYCVPEQSIGEFFQLILFFQWQWISVKDDLSKGVFPHLKNSYENYTTLIILVLCKVKNNLRMKNTLLIDTIDTADTFTYKLIIIYKNVKIAAKRKFSTNFRLLHALEN